MENTKLIVKDLEMEYFCPICKDTGFINGKTCQCMKEEITRQRQKFLTVLSPAPQADFSGFKLDYYSKKAKELSNGTMIVPYNHMKRIYEYCVAYAQHFSTDNKSLLMLGSTGLGKTHLACSIANEVMSHGYTVMYSSSQSLFSKIEQARFTDEDVISDILNCDLFILDRSFTGHFRFIFIRHILDSFKKNKNASSKDAFHVVPP